MYSVYFDNGEPLNGNKEGKSSSISKVLSLNRVCAFEPHGADVYAT